MFGGPLHGERDAGIRPDRQSTVRLESLLREAAVFGAELEPTYRVLALTLEPTPERYRWGTTSDRRIQLLAAPVSTMLVSLRRVGEHGTKELLTFEPERLVNVVAALDGPSIIGRVFGQAEPRPGEWGPRFSLEGRSTAPDGTARTLRLELESADLRFGLFARFDEVEIRDTRGQPLAVPSS